jgi:hypothetical protein
MDTPTPTSSRRMQFSLAQLLAIVTGVCVLLATARWKQRTVTRAELERLADAAEGT